MKFEQITDAIANHGEGPVWWAATSEMRFLDMLAGEVIALDQAGNTRRLTVGAQVAACLRPRVGGGAIVARTRDIAVCRDEDLTDLTTVTGDFIDEAKRFNEGGCDPDGRFYAGNMSWKKTVGESALYCLADTQSEPELVLDGVTTSNGIGFSPDHRLAYYNDTETMTTSVFDYSPEEGLTNRRVFVKYAAKDGRPDGLCIDSEGGVWVAMNRAGHVRRYSPEGTMDACIDVPATMTTALAFGGNDLGTIFVTTSCLSAPDEEKTRAGALFAGNFGIKGLAPLAFGN